MHDFRTRHYATQAAVFGVVHFVISIVAGFLHFAFSFSADHYSRSWIVSIVSAPLGLVLDPTNVLLGTSSFAIGLAIFVMNSSICGAMYYALRRYLSATLK